MGNGSGHSQAGIRISWIDLGRAQERDAFDGAFEAQSSGSWHGVTVLDGWANPHERTEGYFPSHVIAVNRGCAVPFEATLPGRLRYSGAVRPGHVNVWPAGMPHAIRWLRQGSWCVIQVDPGMVADIAEALEFGGSLDLRPSLGALDPVAAHLATAIGLASSEGGQGGRLLRESLGSALVGHILQTYVGSGASPACTAPFMRGAPLGSSSLRRVVEYIETHLEAELSLSELAGVVGMNVFRFVRAFKAATGQPPHRYLMQTRVDRAKALLRASNLSVSDVALRTGFPNPSHFAVTFRRIVGSSPRAWRCMAH
jgi:AraC family transcriptional regulator